MTAGSAASRRVLARTPVAPLPASSPTRPTGITGRMSAPPETSSPGVCSFRLPQMCGFRLPLTPSSRGLTTAMDGRRRKTVHAARRPEERPKDASHSSTFTECTAAMLTLPSFAGPTSARSVTRTVRMRFSVGTGVRVGRQRRDTRSIVRGSWQA